MFSHRPCNKMTSECTNSTQKKDDIKYWKTPTGFLYLKDTTAAIGMNPDLGCKDSDLKSCIWILPTPAGCTDHQTENMLEMLLTLAAILLMCNCAPLTAGSHSLDYNSAAWTLHRRWVLVRSRNGGGCDGCWDLMKWSRGSEERRRGKEIWGHALDEDRWCWPTK